MSLDKSFPSITPVEWLSARQVLGGEASDFTPWLVRKENLDALGAALRLDELTFVATEHNVLGKRLDILANATDEDGAEIAVCIENQYGVSDPDHLGRLIAYLAQHERGRAVWVVEEAHEAFVAAMRFLNRTSSGDAGYFLVQVRFTHGSLGGYQVHFEVLAAPIAWEQPAVPRRINKPKRAHARALLDELQRELPSVGFPTMNTRGSYIWVAWPLDLWYRQYAIRLVVRVLKGSTAVVVFARSFSTREANTQAITILKDAYASDLAARVPPGSDIRWYSSKKGSLPEAVRVELPGVGYSDGDIDETAAWVVDVCRVWLELFRERPILDLAEQVRQVLPGAMDGLADEYDENGDEL